MRVAKRSEASSRLRSARSCSLHVIFCETAKQSVSPNPLHVQQTLGVRVKAMMRQGWPGTKNLTRGRSCSNHRLIQPPTMLLFSGVKKPSKHHSKRVRGQANGMKHDVGLLRRELCCSANSPPATSTELDQGSSTSTIGTTYQSS